MVQEIGKGVARWSPATAMDCGPLPETGLQHCQLRLRSGDRNQSEMVLGKGRCPKDATQLTRARTVSARLLITALIAKVRTDYR